MKPFFALLLLLLPYLSTAQPLERDSLRKLIAASEGEDRLDYYVRLTNIYFGEASNDAKLDTLLSLYRDFEAEIDRQGTEKYKGLIRYNTVAVFSNRNEYHKVIQLAPENLRFASKHERWNTYYSIYTLYVEAYWKKGEFGNAIVGARAMYDHATQHKHEEGIAQALFSLATIYGAMNRPLEEEKYIRECLDAVEYQYNIWHIKAMSFVNLSSLLIKKGAYEQALFYAQKFESITRQVEEERNAKFPDLWHNLWRLQLRLHIAQGATEQAEIYCQHLESAGGATNLFEAALGRAQISYERQQYHAALSEVNKALTLSLELPKRLERCIELKVKIMCALQGMNELHELFVELTHLRDSARETELNANLDEIRTLYEVDKINAQKERAYNNFLFALAGCALLSVALGIWIFYSRKVVRKNRGLYLQIKEQDRLAEELEAMTRRYQQLASPSDTEVDKNLPGNPQQQELVSRLLNYLRLDKNFTKPNVERQELINVLATNKTYLFESVKAVTGKTLQEYVNLMRTDEAKRMLDLHPDYTIDVIADACGFSAIRTFYRIFNEHYQITPSEYRKMARMGV